MQYLHYRELYTCMVKLLNILTKFHMNIFFSKDMLIPLKKITLVVVVCIL